MSPETHKRLISLLGSLASGSSENVSLQYAAQSGRSSTSAVTAVSPCWVYRVTGWLGSRAATRAVSAA
ncbi:hypothetical protein ACI2L4_19805 [Streptomyces sparsogenes]|uniref:hypothetical protein n=1 Tax=Streptomyces sparsogenes TaxID=67365 RepID=UPI00384E27CF